mmetsp:Transcript_19235/g.40097  ORF Transcript_19235/g.40097 Transcript_19235/m.40097 type:complete len:218 (-) Transcript_19235:2818-3471(-)
MSSRSNSWGTRRALRNFFLISKYLSRLSSFSLSIRPTAHASATEPASCMSMTSPNSSNISSKVTPYSVRIFSNLSIAPSSFMSGLGLGRTFSPSKEKMQTSPITQVTSASNFFVEGLLSKPHSALHLNQELMALFSFPATTTVFTNSDKVALHTSSEDGGSALLIFFLRTFFPLFDAVLSNLAFFSSSSFPLPLPSSNLLFASTFILSLSPCFRMAS